MSLFNSCKGLIKDQIIKGKAANSLQSFINFIENCAETINEFSSDEFVEKVINESGLIEHHMKEKVRKVELE